VETLIRLVYASRSQAVGGQRDVELRQILAVARAHNALASITGLLLAANGHFVQLLEGPQSAVQALYERISADQRHADVKLLKSGSAHERLFPQWSMGLVERSEEAQETAKRMRRLRDVLSRDEAVRSSDFLRLFAAPCLTSAPRAYGGEPVTGVAFACPTGLWSAAALQHAAAVGTVRTSRTVISDMLDPTRKSLLEFADFELPSYGPLRAMSLTRDPTGCLPAAPAIGRLDLIVLLVSTSDADLAATHLRSWVDVQEKRRQRPTLLVLCSLPDERRRVLRRELDQMLAFEIVEAEVRPGDTRAVWQAVQRTLHERRAASAWPAVLSADTAVVPLGEPLAPAEPAAMALPSSSTPREGRSASLRPLQASEGFVAAALLGTEPPRVLDRVGDAREEEHVGNAALLTLMSQTLRALSPDDEVEDVAITSAARLQVMHNVGGGCYIALTLDRVAGATIAVARMRLQELAAQAPFS
jgi:Sensors of blue-light using FAD